jgi:pimeloyl-ACP methyl ester carboxylesterase
MAACGEGAAGNPTTAGIYTAYQAGAHKIPGDCDEEAGPTSGVPVLLMHGFPYDPRAFDEVVPPLAAAGCRVIVPYLRGYGATRFLSAATARSGQQGAIGSDLLELLDALELPSAALVGFDWGGRAACIVAALWPQRVRCLVSSNRPAARVVQIGRISLARGYRPAQHLARVRR